HNSIYLSYRNNVGGGVLCEEALPVVRYNLLHGTDYVQIYKTPNRKQIIFKINQNIFVKMSLHIGSIIKKIAKNNGYSQGELAEKINAENAQNVEYDYRQENLPIDKLALYSAALEHNFLQYYYEMEPFKTYRQKELESYLSQIDSLTNQLQELNRLLHAKEETTA